MQRDKILQDMSQKHKSPAIEEMVEETDEWTVLHPQEASLVGRLCHLLEERGDEAQKGVQAIKEGLVRVERLWQAIDDFPSVHSRESLGARTRSFETLIEAFSHINPYVTEAYLPTRAVLGRGYAMAKFNFCRMLGILVEEFLSDGKERDELRVHVEEVMRSSVCTLIAEDLLISIAADERISERLRRKAAVILAGLWEERNIGAVSEFAGLLISIWNAKSRITINYGTLAGISELFCLSQAGCDPGFLAYFCREDVSEDEQAALQEFMFNATYEELSFMRRYMREHDVKALGAKDVARIFNVPMSRLHRTTHTAQDIFFTFRERQEMASQRMIRSLPGPKKTAEEYVMIYLLGQSGDREEDGVHPAG